MVAWVKVIKSLLFLIYENILKIGEYVIITKEMKRNKNIWQDCENIFYEQRKILIQKNAE